MSGEIPTLAPRPDRRGWMAGAALVLLVLAVFSPLLLRGEFFWDDKELLTDNRFVRAPGGLSGIWFSFANPDYYPVMSTSFWLEWRVWGHWPIGYHLTNMLLHAGSAILLWRVLRRLEVPGAFLAAAVFAVHPVNVESVAWIAERKNTLSMLLMLAAALLYFRSDAARLAGKKWGGSLALAAGLFLLSLLSKTAGVMLPVVLLILTWWRRKRITRADLLSLAPFFAISLLMGLVTIYVQYTRAIGDTPIRTDGLASRAATAGLAVWFYLGKALVPANLMFNYPRWPDLSAAGGIGFLPLAALLFVFVWLIVATLRRKSPVARAGLVALACYVVMLLPLLGFLNIYFMRYSLVSDHWQYHAMPAILAWAVGGAVWLDRQNGGAIRLATRGLAVAALAWCIGYSAYMANVYATPESIWQHTLRGNPRSHLAMSSLGAMRFEAARKVRGQGGDAAALFKEALDYYSRARAAAPLELENTTNLANVQLDMGDTAAALQTLSEGLAVSTSDKRSAAGFHYAFGEALVRNQRPDMALPHFRRAAELLPKFYPAWLRVGDLLVKRYDATQDRAALDEAVRAIQHAVAVKPDSAAARVQLAEALLRAGDRGGAIIEASTAHQLAPNDPAVRKLLDRINSGQ